MSSSGTLPPITARYTNSGTACGGHVSGAAAMATGSSTRRSSASSAGAWFLLAVKLRKPSPPHWDRRIASGFQAIFCRRRHQPRRSAQAKNAPLKSLAQTGDLYRYMTKVLAPAFD
jgi:hypothetical protein